MPAKKSKKSRQGKKKAPPGPVQDDAPTPSDSMAHSSDATGTEAAGRQQVFQPGVHELDEGEELDYDRTAYDCLVKWRLEWPCLSFDVARDSLGDRREAFPHTAYLVAGTQAPQGERNHLAVMRLANLTQGDHGKRKRSGGDSDSDVSSSDLDDDDAPSEARFHYRNVAVPSAVNRVSCMYQQPGIVAAWGADGSVAVHNVNRVLTELAEEEQPRPKGKNNLVHTKPLFSHRHSTEGFALAWSRQVVGALATGDCNGKLHTWQPHEGGAWEVSGSYAGHTNSVEDVKWSPTEATVLASACVDKRIRVYDTRDKSKAQLTLEAHTSDVNVLAWNALTTYMVATGGDDGLLRVWDLRALSSHVASFAYHKKPICGLQWCPHESSMLATSSEDDSVAVWDLALERDPEEEAQLAAAASLRVEQSAPPQLLFLHAGQRDVREVRWHAQIPGALVATAGDGFNLFKPANVFELPPRGAERMHSDSE